MNIKPVAPKLNTYIKTHKENEPIRPVVNNIQAPSYKTSKYVSKTKPINKSTTHTHH